MGNTDMYKSQHDGLMEIAAMISTRLDASELGQDAQEVRSLLSKLAGKLKVHLAMEDKSLYPTLLEHPDEKVRSITLSYKQEMGDMANTFYSYMDSWSTTQAIQDSPDEFINQTNQLFSALTSRIAREDKELYQLAEGK